MENPIVESELQDICSFRKTIIDSSQKIQRKISKTKTPLKLNSSCNCTQENPPLNSFDIHSFEDETINYITEKDGFWSNRKPKKQKIQKNDRLKKYLMEYDLNKFNFEIQPLGQKKFLNNDEKLFHTRNPLKNNSQSEKIINSTFQNTQISFSNQNIPVVKNRRKNISNHGNYDKLVHNLSFKQKNDSKRPKSEFKEHKENKFSSRSKAQIQKTVIKNKSFIETPKQKQIKRRAVSTKGIQTHRQPSNTKRQLSSKQQIKDEIYKRIKNRMYLSCVVYKSSQDCFMAIYQKELQERQDIVNKIVGNPHVIQKFGKIIRQN